MKIELFFEKNTRNKNFDKIIVRVAFEKKWMSPAPPLLRGCDYHYMKQTPDGRKINENAPRRVYFAFFRIRSYSNCHLRIPLYCTLHCSNYLWFLPNFAHETIRNADLIGGAIARRFQPQREHHALLHWFQGEMLVTQSIQGTLSDGLALIGNLREWILVLEIEPVRISV